MQNIRCAHCGLLNFASAGECKRCHAPLAEGAQPSPAFDARGSSPRGAGAGGRALRWLAVLAVSAAAGFAAYSYRYHVWYGAHAEYALAIGGAERFNEPVSIKAKKRIALGQGLDGPSHGGRDRSDPVHVLRARGLVEFGATRTQERVVGTYTPPPSMHPGIFGDNTAPAPEPFDIRRTYHTTDAALTPAGEQVAGAWGDADDGRWLVPIGSREVFAIVSVGEVEASAGVERRDVEFSWRWRPNGVGEAFDTDGKFYLSLSGDARNPVLQFNWGSAKVYRAVAHFERRPGGNWQVVGIEKSDDIDGDNELSAF